MSVISEDSVFTSLQQHGPLAVEDSVYVTKPFSSHTKKWVKNLCRERINITKLATNMVARPFLTQSLLPLFLLF